MNILPFRFVLFIIGLFLTFNAPALKAQSALDGFDPNPSGSIHALVVQPDGKIIIGGAFTNVSPNGVTVNRNCIARFNPDGTLDAAFNPYANNVVYGIAVQPDGKVLVAGRFTAINGQPRNYVARLDAVTGQPDSFNPSPWNPDPYFGHVRAIAVQSDGKILIGGDFHKVGGSAGQVRISIARLDGNTGLPDSFSPNSIYNRVIWSIVIQRDGKILVAGSWGLKRLDKDTGLPDSFSPNPNNWVFAIAIQPDGKILVGGDFTNIGGQRRNHIARLDKDTGLADSFDPNASGGSGGYTRIYSIAVQPDGKILAGGDFTHIRGRPRNYITRLNAVTGLPDSFNPSLSNQVYAVAVQPDGKMLAGGEFVSVSSNGGALIGRSRIARFEKDGLLEQTLNLSLIGDVTTPPAVWAIAVQPDGKILIGGDFTSVLGVPRKGIARLNADGTLDTNFNPYPYSGTIYAIAVQPDGKILIGGNFQYYIGGQPGGYMARLDKDTGAMDSFAPYAAGPVYTIAIQPDSKILVSGGFSRIGGESRPGIARLDATTGFADSFNPQPNTSVTTIAIQPDGKILVGGYFSNIGGQPRNRLARLDKDTGLADSFDPNPNNQVTTIAIQADGKILVGGIFTNIGGEARNHIARLDATTGLADSFNPNAQNWVDAIAVQSDGKILVGGYFSSIGGQPRSYIARLNAATGAADSFISTPNGSVYVIAIQPDGKILVGGYFSNIGGQLRNRFARLTNAAALSSLSVNRTTVTLTRDGSAVLFKRVVFELSTDNGASWTTLGTATNSFAPSSPLTGTNETGENQLAELAPEAASYALTGLNLPTGQNILVRARGVFSSGWRNGSESIEDKVKIAFLPVPATQVSVSGRVMTSDGSGLGNAQVILTDASGNSRTTATGSFGYFRFDSVQAGETYVFSVVAKGYQFAPQVVTVNEELPELNFTAQ
ncbi:MAG TPA: carboxypeptidase regulatory-like domain-containing protein [Pyrinomonadaceae bacterium]|jgi:uncharacterized delta-60 repeat protein